MTIETLTERYFHEKAVLEKALEDWNRRLTARAREVDSNASVSGRVKSYRSFLGKAYRKTGEVRSWENFGDLVALKAIFPTKRGVDEFSEWLLGKIEWSPKLDEKEGSPSELKYQAMQFDLAAPDITDSKGAPLKIEVQVRTAASDAWYVVDHRLQYKGIVDLPPELKRKLNRLIVFAELFDEEVEAVISRQSELPEYAAARLYEDLIKLSEFLFGDHTRTSRPEGLFELVLSSYTEDEMETLACDLESFVDLHREHLVPLIRDHHYESDNYVEDRDWIYYEPEALLIAERALTKPSMIKHVLRGSDFEFVVLPMVEEFRSTL